MPGIKAVGTNTAERTRAMPTTGPESSSIAFKAAFFGVMPSSMCRSTPSTTTMASSTTRPIASTRPKRESGLMEQPHQGNNTNLATCDAVVLGTQFDPGDITDPHSPPVGSFTHHDLSEFFRGHKAALRENRVGKFLALGRRFAAGLPSRVHCVLCLNSADDFGNGDAQLCQLVRLDPQPHCILARTEYLNVADARRARERIVDIDVGVVRQHLGVIRSMRRVQGN